MRITDEQAAYVIGALEEYHCIQDAMADAMDFADAAKWHNSVAKWLRDKGLKEFKKANNESTNTDRNN